MFAGSWTTLRKLSVPFTTCLDKKGRERRNSPSVLACHLSTLERVSKGRPLPATDVATGDYLSCTRLEFTAFHPQRARSLGLVSVALVVPRGPAFMSGSLLHAYACGWGIFPPTAFAAAGGRPRSRQTLLYANRNYSSSFLLEASITFWASSPGTSS